jgi:hypothetical protein
MINANEMLKISSSKDTGSENYINNFLDTVTTQLEEFLANTASINKTCYKFNVPIGIYDTIFIHKILLNLEKSGYTIHIPLKSTHESIDLIIPILRLFNKHYESSKPDIDGNSNLIEVMVIRINWDEPENKGKIIYDYDR